MLLQGLLSRQDGRGIAGNWPGLKDRLHAWWDGEEYVPAEKSDPPPDPSSNDEAASGRSEPDPVLDETPTVAHWPPPRILAAQHLFGEDFVGPMNAEMIRTFSKPFGFTEQNSVVELGCGLGGAARLIAKDTGTWVDGFEADAELAQAGAFLSEKAGLAKRAKIACAEATEADVRNGSRDAVLCFEQLGRMEDKASLALRVRKMLKAGGQALFVEPVTGDLPADSRETAAWLHAEAQPLHLIASDALTLILGEAGFSVRTGEDITDEYRESVVAAFAAYEESIKGQVFDEDLRTWILKEGELWCSRFAALDAGAYRIYRFFCRVTG